MLEHSAMYLNVTPPYEEDASFFPDFYTTRLGPCDLQDPVWAKMSALAGVNKKRKKSETKPQAQINKCNNEKRRREQENIYIEELAELISANFADMSSLSVKPDKCAILQETVNQIRSIKQQESASQSTDPVQQGEVSSSRPTILSNELYGPLLLEVLEGFLFVVNGEGKVEHVTENVSTYIKFTREDILGKSIYNFIHHGDHAKFHSNLLPMIEWGNEQQPTNRSKSIDIRLLVKPPDELEESVEEKQQRVSCYELMHISSTQLRDQVSVSEEDGSDNGPCLLCIASRISHREKTSCSIEQFTTKLDTTGKIICVDTSGVSETIAQYIKKDLKNRVLRDLVSQQDVQKINAHLRETVSAGQSTSAIYRLQIGTDKFIQVQTKSKLFKSIPHASNDTDFIMATHSIIGENEAVGPTDPGGGNTSGGGVGGPLMTSVVNGTRNGPPVCSGGDSSTTTSNNTLLNTNTTTSFTTAFNLDNDFNFDIFPTSTWELEPTSWQDARPDSRQSVTPVSTPTPRPPSNPSYSNAPTVVHSPLSHFGTQPSPTVPNPSTPANPYGNTFPFSPLNEQNYPMEEQKDTKGNALEEAVVSNRLRILLTKPPNNVETANEADKSRDRILKELLNQQDEDSNKIDNRSSPRGLMSRGSMMPGPSEPPKTSTSSGNNNMLRQLLNDKSDDDDLESKAGVKKKSELLQQLLKPERDIEEDKKNDLQSQDDSLLRSLGFPPCSPVGDRGKKRLSDDKDDNPNKRSADGSQVTSSGSTGSKLCEKNKMLASLLAKQPTNHQPIPPIPASVISATPQEKLPKITDPNKTLQMNMMNQNMQHNILNTSRMNASRMSGRSQNTNYLSAVLSNNMQRNENRQINQINSVCYTSPATSSTDNNNSGWDNNNLQTSNDPLLSDILDQVIDIVPDDIMQLLSGSEGQQPNNFQTGLSETMAINIIQKSLMQCESAVKSPASPISMPGTPPAYSATSVSQNQSGVFPPPPNYSQSKFQRMQVRPGQPQYPANINNQLILQHQRKQLLHQQEQKRRLLQQQKQQQLLIPSNAAASEMNPSMQNIESLLNNTVAPNVSLQRSASVPEPQLSPGYGGQINQQNQRVGNQQPYSPHSQLTSPLGQQSFTQTTVGNYQNPGARLSPQAQFNPQLSPRQAYPQGNTQSTANWQQTQARLTVQQNPMLSAQLTRPPQQQRSINSPGTVPTRHSPYPADQFPPPSSPNSAFNNQYLRLQRTNSAPTPSTQMPGGLGSPRPYTGREHHPHSYPNIPPHHNVPPMMYQQDSQFCYDQAGLPLAYNGADRGRAPPHLQPGVSGSGPTSEFVRQELRAVVGARTGQTQPAGNRPPSQLMSQQQQVNDLESLGINFEMATGASDSPKLWGAMGSDMGSMSPQPATSRSSMEEGRQGDQKSSLLQKLLSE
ncbi:nuclear receptor coactivator 1 isoform X2 [Anoplophora glabripennis]|uniref:nuclear receptor coactivator 1 isoform X2 n=1 Tax=Anoplophora glabripennis TaxID=217634 RepID=UPI000874DA9D|nr:nuclear receptor coactivator 1 isoform X2 [Anoplophora glabripennis]